MLAQKKIVLAHDSFTQLGGAERVVAELAAMYPDAPIFTLVADEKIVTAMGIAPSRIKTTWLQGLYKLFGTFQWLFPLAPLALATSRVPDADVIISSSSAFIKGLRKGKAVHINYCHTPTRFLWIDPQHAYKEIPHLLHPLAKLMFGWLKIWDLRAARRVDAFIANSKEVVQRIKDCYKRDSELIYPFIDTEFWQPSRPKQSYFLVAGRLQYGKGLDVIIEAAKQLDLPLHVAGTGRYEPALRSMAGKQTRFLGRISDEELRDEYSGARAFIYPQVEDFGLMPLEAASCGAPTIGLAKAGSLETILPGVTGELLAEFSIDTLRDALKKIDNSNLDIAAMQQHVQKFAKSEFGSKIKQFVEKVYHAHHS